MSNDLSNALAKLGLTLPKVTTPNGSYVPTVLTGNLLFVAGQTSQSEGLRYAGTLGADMSLEQGQEAARLCALNILAHVDAVVGGALDRVVRCVRLGGFVQAAPGFVDHPKVLNGASDLIVSLLGERGRHARTAVGVASLPRGLAVEIDAIFEVAL